MIYLTNGNTPLNAAYADKISQEANSTYQLTFRFPTSDALWEKLKAETFLKADDLHGEQDFVIFEVQKKQGYIQVYANQSFTLLNNYVINPISLDRATGSTALSRFAGSITRDNPFSFFSDIDERHTFNTDSINAMVAFTKDKHSILGQWGGDLVRHGYQVRLLKNGGSENESLFMYKKNLSSYQQKTSTKSLKTRITFKTTVKGEGEKAPDRKFSVVVDSPLINKYSQIYEDVIEVNDQSVKDEATLRKYGEQYFRNTLCDMLEDSLEIQVEGKSDVPVQIFDIVSLFHDRFKMDVRKKITKYTYSPMAKKLLSIGFGQFKSGLSNMLSNAVSDAVKNETQHLQGQFATQLAKEIKNADLAFDRKKEDLVNQFTDGLNAAKARAEEVKRQLSDTIDQRFSSFDNGPLQEVKRRADEALRNAGASSSLAQEARQISEQVRQQLDRKADLVEFQRVKETNQLYERIIGRSESDIADKVARIALTNQLFQVEVAKNVGDSRNYVKNADFRGGSKNWKESNISGLNFNYEHSSQNRNKSGVHIYGTSINARYFGLQQTFKIELKKSDKITLSFLVSKDGYNTFSGLDVGLHYRKDGAIKSQAWKEISNSDITASTYKKLSFNYELPVDIDEINLMFYGNPGKSINLYISEVKLETGSKATPFTLAPEDTDEAVRTVQNQLAGSWAVQNLTSAGSIVSQINVTNNQILIEAEKIRLKGKTLLDELTAIDGYFKRLFVGEGNFSKLNAEIIGSKTITADKLIMDQAMARMFVSSDIFTDTLAAKEAFINKLRSVVVTATLLEGYKGKIGGFQIGTHDKDPNTFWITGANSFRVGMGDVGPGNWGKTALWVNWGDDWNKPGENAWFVNARGEMMCYNRAHFWNVPIIHGDLRVDGDIFYQKDQYNRGFWIYSPDYKKITRSNGYLYLYGANFGGSDWIPMNKEISDRRYKHNIEASTVSGLDIIEQLKTYSYRKEYDDKVEDISCGIMAQDVQKYVPEAFFENPDGAYSYRTFELVPYLIKAIQELNHKIEKMEKTDERTGQTNQQSSD
ncbi:tail fiber domain-containing protein [Streptococcus sp. CF8-6]|uniref:phage tail spike protein n=1 Tax=Streptococcus sp. CF8-6 TaxID=2963150 RepID=UPI0020C8BB88|nr:phage tail spike protein [Streptococcus sp. CF8-6]MCP9017287.1 tail fiber domain-containing protein [Streptococcus sp. CF8-6]